jgi:hypothetical protein
VNGIGQGVLVCAAIVSFQPSFSVTGTVSSTGCRTSSLPRGIARPARFADPASTRHERCNVRRGRQSRGTSAAQEDHMKRIAQVIAIAVALAAFPAAADEGEPIPGSDRDPFSQTYTGRDPEEVRAEREREQRKASHGTCACGHKGAAQEHPKAR